MTARAYVVRVVGLLAGVAAWDLGPVPQVHPAIRAWDAGVRE